MNMRQKICEWWAGYYGVKVVDDEPEQQAPVTIEQVVKAYHTLWNEAGIGKMRVSDWLDYQIPSSLRNKALPIAQEQWYNEHPPRNIGEPVLTILKALKERPETFEIDADSSIICCPYTGDAVVEGKIIDTQKGVDVANLTWANSDESKAIREEITAWLLNKADKLNAAERERVKALYHVKGE